MLVFSIKTVAWFEPELDGFLRSCRQKCISGTSPLAKRTVYMKLSPESPVTEPASSNSISMISPFSPCRRVSGPLPRTGQGITFQYVSSRGVESGYRGFRRFQA